MASSQTTNYGLNQWAAEDAVLREEFNQDNAKLDAVLTKIDLHLPQIASGSYIGDGTFGAEHPTSLTFPFVPKLVICYCPETTTPPGLYLYGQEEHLHDFGNVFTQYLTWSGMTLSWYCEIDASTQWNYKGRTYQYFAFAW